MNQKKLNKAGPLHNKGNKILYNNRVSLNWYLPPVLGNKPTCINSYFSQIVTSYYIKIALWKQANLCKGKKPNKNKTPTKNNQEKPLEMREALLLCCMLAVKCIHSLILVICSLGPTVRNPVDGLQCLPLTSWTSCWWRRKWNTIKVYFSCKSFDIRPSQTANLCLD